MDQRTWVWGLAIVLIIAAVAWYIVSITNPAPTADEQAAAMTAEASSTAPTTAAGSAASTQQASGSGNTFKSIFSQSGSHECDYSQVEGASRTTSAIYIANGKMRGEFRTTGDTPTASLMVYNGGYLYSWKEGTTEGTRTSIASVADLPEAIPQDLSGGAIYGTNLDNVGWLCHPWIPDASLLTPPSYVAFSS